MAKAPPIKKRMGIVPRENRSTFDSSVADGIANPTQAQTSINRSGSGGVPSTNLSTTSESSGRGLLPVTHKQVVGTSQIQQAISPGDIVFEKRSQDKLHKVQIFSSQKIPQPFLDR